MAIARGLKSGAMMFLGPVSSYSIKEIVEATGIRVAWNAIL